MPHLPGPPSSLGVIRSGSRRLNSSHGLSPVSIEDEGGPQGRMTSAGFAGRRFKRFDSSWLKTAFFAAQRQILRTIADLTGHVEDGDLGLPQRFALGHVVLPKVPV